MIEVEELRKLYTTGSFTQKALDGVSITFRENEFVAILGPSGSGKTTLLNILGGLDHADSGEITINGVPTHNYKSADWDTYRNHRIGFIFQSYNLIPHQTVLSNVELALTLSGVSRSERRERATRALERVGIGEHLNKRPSQLSGGQAQRVAIARALVNEPDIVLADEPTGALDTETGNQVMNLLSEIASDRLVIMVTHNPDLAYRYADRIVKLADGRITDDSKPVTVEERRAADAKPSLNTDGTAASSDAAASAVSTKNRLLRWQGKPFGRKKHASMSFLTALSLSFSNLMTKKGRTFLTAFAGSIGIIGIAAILALSNGVNNHINDVEEQTMSSYPLSIAKSSFNSSAFLGTKNNASQDSAASSSDASGNVAQTDGSAAIPERTVVSDMFASIKNNDLKSFKKWLEGDGAYVNNYTNAISYRYNVTPIIYTNDAKNPKKLNPSAIDDYNNLDAMGSSLSQMASMGSFSEMMSNQGVLDSQFEVVKGKWPEKYDECVLVLNSKGKISDFTLYNIGVLDPSEFFSLYKKALGEQKVKIPDTKTNFTYDDALNTSFKVVNAAALYSHDTAHDAWIDKSDSKPFVRQAVKNGTTLKIVGVVKARDSSSAALHEGIAYRQDLIEHLMRQSAQSAIVKEQRAHPSVDVFTGKTFSELKKSSKLDMGSLITVDEQALRASLASGGDATDLTQGLSGLNIGALIGQVDTTAIAKDLKDMPAPEISSDDIKLSPAQQAQLTATANGIISGFMKYYLDKHPGEPIRPDTDFSADFQSYLQQDSVRKQLEQVYKTVGASASDQVEALMQKYLTESLQPYLQKKLAKVFEDMAAQMAPKMAAAMSQSIQSALETKMASMSGRLAQALRNSISINVDQHDLSQMLENMMGGRKASYEGNLAKLGYAKKDAPESINLYAKDFDNKELLLQAIDSYNSKMKEEGKDDSVISYSDMVGALISSVSDIVNLISQVLIAFVSISLVVSSIMIGIITYISVLERRKEIGLLRAMGASKTNVANIFNAETVIEGLIAGVIAIVVVLLVSIPVNAFVLEAHQVPNVMSLPWSSAIILILISVALTFIAGLIPSVNASRKDPVEALRSE